MNLAEFQARVQANPRPVIVDIWAPWCGPCRTLSPRLAQVSEAYADQVDVWQINADEAPELTRALKIMGIPTLLMFRDGQEVARRTGLQSVDALRTMFDALLVTDANGAAPRIARLSDTERWLRLTTGAILVGLPMLMGWSPFLVIVGAAVIFSGVYDRCPLWQAITAKLRAASRTA
ncbi:MAG TPA: thioredoxin [Chloroflexi bacterium]|nr:thioredoxin [Chloroflexota bacterium]